MYPRSLLILSTIFFIICSLYNFKVKSSTGASSYDVHYDLSSCIQLCLVSICILILGVVSEFNSHKMTHYAYICVLSLEGTLVSVVFIRRIF